MDCKRYRELKNDPAHAPPKEELKEYFAHRRECAACRLGITSIEGQGQGSTPPATPHRHSQQVAVSEPSEPEPLEFDPTGSPKSEAEVVTFLDHLRAKTPA